MTLKGVLVDWEVATTPRMALSMPEPLARLVMMGRWNSILLLGRWLSNPWFVEQSFSIAAGFPDQMWLRYCDSGHEERHEVAVQMQDVLKVVTAASPLCEHSQAVLARDFYEHTLGFRQEGNKTLKEAVRVHMHVPVAIGSAAGGVEHKSVGLLHCLAAESANQQEVAAYLESILPHTTDLGAEVKLADISAGKRAWQGVEKAPQPVGDGPVLENFAHLMPNSIVVPGALRLLDTVIKDVATSLLHWDRFHQQLKVVDRAETAEAGPILCFLWRD